jgi:lysophospholipase L1-like esterase
MSTLFIIIAIMTLFMASCGINEMYEQNNSIIAETEASVVVDSVTGSSNTVVFDNQSYIEQSNESKISTFKQGTLNIVALGDSIPRGYGLENPEKDCFPSQIATYFSMLYSEVNLTNYAVDGMTSSGLLEQLQNGESPAIESADIIMICVGANNVLPCAYDLIYINNTDVTTLFNNYGSFLLSNKSDKTASYALSSYFDSINEYASSSEFAEKINSGVELLRADIPKIIKEIRSKNTYAKIYFTTLYSPYEKMNITLPYVKTAFPMGNLSDKFICLLNNEITALSIENGYDVVDIYTAFKNDNSKNVNAGIDLLNLQINFDPHPNITGHTLIANEFIKIINGGY